MSLLAVALPAEPTQDTLPSSATNVIEWSSLPVEVRRMILSQLGVPNLGRRPSGSGPKVARFAAVCRKWQDYFEPRLFRRLVLDPESLDRFDYVIRQRDFRLGYIRKLWLRIKLSKYKCPQCDHAEDVTTQKRNNQIFTTCIQTLLETLSLWDPQKHGSQGLELMLSASSPSDTEHRFSRCEIQDWYPFHYAEDLDVMPSMAAIQRILNPDQFRLYNHRGCSPPWYEGHLDRVHGTPLRLLPRRDDQGRFINSPNCLPAVPIVKGLLLRKQFRREIHLRTLSLLLNRSFVALEWFRFERTMSPDPGDQVTFATDCHSHLIPSLPKTLRWFSFTQWEPARIERGDEFEDDDDPETPLHDHDDLHRQMAKLCQRLDQFCPPWQIDTSAFLRSIMAMESPKDMAGSSLRRLSLHCSLSCSDTSREEFESLVSLAAKAALRLPRLQVMEIWGVCLDGLNSRAYIFQYINEDHRTSIVWRSSGKTLAIEKNIMARWSQVAQKHSRTTIASAIVPITATGRDISKSAGTCLYRHLLLKDLIFDPVSRLILGHDSTTSYSFPFMDSSEPNPDIASLQEESIDFEARVTSFLELHCQGLVWRKKPERPIFVRVGYHQAGEHPEGCLTGGASGRTSRAEEH